MNKLGRQFKQKCSVRRTMDGDFQAGATLVIWYRLPGSERDTELTFAGVGKAGSAHEAIIQAVNNAYLLLSEFEKEIES